MPGSQMVDINNTEKTIKASPRVSIVIVNYNGKHVLKDCLSSIDKLDYPKGCLDTKLIDNGSKDGSTSYITKNFPFVKVIKNPENNFCKANNLGIRESQSDYIALLNNDTVVDRKWLKELIKVIAKDQKIGCVGSKILFPDGRIQSTGHYEFPNFYWGDRGFNEPNLGQYEYLEEVSSLSGASLLFRRDCLEDVGYFDEDFVMYLEDVDMFLRCRQRNWKLLYCPSSIVYHKFHSTADEKSVRFYIERNRLLLIAKHFPAELSRSLEHKEHSLLDGQVYKILPDIFTKLIKSHDLKTVETSMQGLFVALQRLYNLSKDKAVQQLNNSLKESEITKESLQHAKTQLETEITRRQEEVNKLNQEVKKYEVKHPFLNDVLNGKKNLEEALNSKIRELEILKVEFNNQQRKLEISQLDFAHKEEVLRDIEKQRNSLFEETHKRAGEINQLKEQLKQLEIEHSKLSDTNSLKNSLEETLTLKTQELEFLKAELNNQQWKLELFQHDAAHKQEVYQEIEKQRNALIEETHKRADQISQLQEGIKQFDIERARLQEIINTKNAIEESLKQKTQETEALKIQFNGIQGQLGQLRQDFTHKQEIYQEIEKQRNVLLEETHKRADQISQLQEGIKQLDVERIRLQEIANAKNAIEEALKLKNQETESLKAELSNTQGHLGQLQQDFARKQEAYQEIEKQRVVLQEQTQEDIEEAKQLRLKINELEVERLRLKGVEDEKIALEIELNTRKHELEDTNKQAEEQKANLVLLQAQKNELIFENTQRIEEISFLQNNINQLQGRISILESERFRLEEIASEKSEVEALLKDKSREIDDLHVRLNEQEKQYELLEKDSLSRRYVLEGIKKDTDNLLFEINSNALQINQLRNEIQALEVERNSLKQQDNQKTNIIAVLETSVASFSFEITQKNNYLKSAKTQLEEKDVLLNSLQQEISICKEGLKTYCQKLIKKTDEVEKLGVYKEDLERKVNIIGEELERLTAVRIEMVAEQDLLINELKVRLESTFKELEKKEDIIKEKGMLVEKSQKDTRAKDEQLNAIYNSQTYKYLAIPLWRVIDFFKRVFNKKIKNNSKNILVIKPFYVPCHLAENSLYDLRSYFPDSQITLLANVYQPDYDCLKGNKQINFKFLFSPECARLTKFKLLCLIFKFNFCHFDETILLVGDPVYQGYRKAKLLAWVSGAKSVRVYFTATKVFAPLYSAGAIRKIKDLIFYLKNTIAFAGIILFFVTAIVMPLKIKKFFKK